KVESALNVLQAVRADGGPVVQLGMSAFVGRRHTAAGISGAPRTLNATSSPLDAGCHPNLQNRIPAFRIQYCESRRDDPHLRNWPIPLEGHRHPKRKDKPLPPCAWGRAPPTRSGELRQPYPVPCP